MRDAAVAAAALLVLLVAVRTALALRALRAPSAAARPVDLGDVTVLVAVRSGDPLLADVLAASVATLSPARVRLLVDDDDPAGAGAARSAAARHDHVTVVTCGPPPAGTNPKVHKLAAVEVTTGTVVVLDDDTALPPGGLARLVAPLQDADLATGVPVYREQGGLWSRLVAAFVNGSALVTYLPLAQVGPPVSINGMVVAVRHDALRSVGGFATLTGATCDDYALARLFRVHGLRLVQTAQPAVVATTIPSAAVYARILRRWLLFAGEVVRRDLSPRLVLLVLLPSVLPAAVAVLAVAARDGRALLCAGAALLASAVSTWVLRRRAGRHATGVLGVLLEPVAAVLAPLQAAAAQVGPRTVTWRGRRVAVGIGAVP